MTIRLLEEPDESLPAYQPIRAWGRLEADDLKEAAQGWQIRHSAQTICAPIVR